MASPKFSALLLSSLMIVGCSMKDEEPIGIFYAPPPDPVRLEELPEVEAYRPVTDRPFYNGPEELLTLTEDNWLQITWAIYRISVVMEQMARKHGSGNYFTPYYLRSLPDEPLFPERCETGTVTRNKHEDYPRTIKTAIYERCAVGEREITGLHLFSAPGFTEPWDDEIWVGDVFVETPDDEITYYSRLKMQAGVKYPLSTSYFGLYSLRLKQAFVGKDLTLKSDGISGRLYVNHEGYLDIPEKSTSEAITLYGANDIALFIFFGDLQEGSTIKIALMDGPKDLKTTEVDQSILHTAPVP